MYVAYFEVSAYPKAWKQQPLIDAIIQDCVLN